MESVESLLEIAGQVAELTNAKIAQIQSITNRSRMLALNATIEAHSVGDAGRGFIVVAGEMKSISDEITKLASSLQGDLKEELKQLSSHATLASSELRKVRGDRLADLAHNAVEIADRNLYERTCDVRWWATDQAVVDCAADPSSEDKRRHASQRLSVILQSYTVYLDLWIADTEGNIIANGRPDRYRRVSGLNVAQSQWFKDAMATRDGDCFAVADIASEPALNGAVTATYSTAIRSGGQNNGETIGALGIFFDWNDQGQAIVDGVSLTPEEREYTTCLLIDSQHRIIASSDRRGMLTDSFPIDRQRGERGHFETNTGDLVGYALTPGYETYRGLGWYGVIVQRG
jgi:hypothetical protein